ncbi:hypothetical protein HELRODRAFT_172208 [Helobdella robusta]|uniref:Centriolar satellite-associated tubulin polyglutamylase complex regulator 1 n=1 Tax=Helobdella robusta TaxID=6412 RepID=T1F553_HELRO|nr:hypothetical protein HELRODRAFT_172208 [Helobdella robusta]ESO04553.1 hypothetical protein HELRODRAFT_172208 [Helobdella robusta]
MLVYLEDATTQLLIIKNDISKNDYQKFFYDYFISVKLGTHVLLREYAFVSATLHNRQSFVMQYYICFNSIGKIYEKISLAEYHSYALLLCSDFPISVMKKNFVEKCRNVFKSLASKHSNTVVTSSATSKSDAKLWRQHKSESVHCKTYLQHISQSCKESFID